MRTREKTGPSWKGRLVLLVAGALGGLVFGELGLRILGIARPEFYHFDPVVGSYLLPGAEGIARAERPTYVRIGPSGFRDREPSREKPEGTLRIAVLGDSFTEAFHVDTADAFWSVLERELEGCAALGARDPEVLAFGVAGIGTAQELLIWRDRAIHYEPDLVVLAFFTGNDLRNNSRALQGSSGRPYMVLEEGRLIVDDRFKEKLGSRISASFLGRIGDFFLVHSRVYQVYRDGRNGWRRRARAREQAAELAAAPPDVAAEGGGTTAARRAQPVLGLDEQVLLPPQDDDWREAWAVTEAILRAMRQEVEATGARFLLTTLSSPRQVDPDPEARLDYMRERGIEDLLYPDRRLGSLAEAEGFDFLMLAEPLGDWAQAHGTCVHRDCNGHWNETGHRLAGELLAEKTCSLLAGS